MAERLDGTGALVTGASSGRPEVRQQTLAHGNAIEKLEAEDIADAIQYIVTRPRRVAVNEILVRPTEQEA